MTKVVTFRVDEGTFMVVAAAAKQDNKAVSAWVRDAVLERIRDHVQRRVIDRLDERVYQTMKDVAAIKSALSHDIAETQKAIAKVQKTIDNLVVEVGEAS